MRAPIGFKSCREGAPSPSLFRFRALCGQIMTIIHTERFVLRPISDDDAPAFVPLCNDESLARATSRIAHPFTLEDALAYTRHIATARAEGNEYSFKICDGDDIVACCGALKDGEDWEIGYWVAAAARGRGVATEAAGAVTSFAIDRLGAETITAGYFVDNPASARVLAKLGFSLTGETVKTHSLGRGEDVETIRMTLAAKCFVRPAGICIDNRDDA